MILLEYRFNISVSEICHSTANIAEAVSLVALLPLIYIAFQPSLLRDNHAAAHTNDDHAQTLRFVLYLICWSWHLYPFSSRMYHAFGPESGELSIIESSQIKNLCFTNVDSYGRTYGSAIQIWVYSDFVGDVYEVVLWRLGIRSIVQLSTRPTRKADELLELALNGVNGVRWYVDCSCSKTVEVENGKRAENVDFLPRMIAWE